MISSHASRIVSPAALRRRSDKHLSGKRSVWPPNSSSASPIPRQIAIAARRPEAQSAGASAWLLVLMSTRSVAGETMPSGPSVVGHGVSSHVLSCVVSTTSNAASKSSVRASCE